MIISRDRFTLSRTSIIWNIFFCIIIEATNQPGHTLLEISILKFPETRQWSFIQLQSRKIK